MSLLPVFLHPVYVLPVKTRNDNSPTKHTDGIMIDEAIQKTFAPSRAKATAVAVPIPYGSFAPAMIAAFFDP